MIAEPPEETYADPKLVIVALTAEPPSAIFKRVDDVTATPEIVPPNTLAVAPPVDNETSVAKPPVLTTSAPPATLVCCAKPPAETLRLA